MDGKLRLATNTEVIKQFENRLCYMPLNSLLEVLLLIEQQWGLNYLNPEDVKIARNILLNSIKNN
jgi:hypothetical protein